MGGRCALIRIKPANWVTHLSFSVPKIEARYSAIVLGVLHLELTWYSGVAVESSAGVCLKFIISASD